MRRKRIAVAAAIGATFGVLAYVLLRARGTSIQAADFTYVWLAARAILHGQNPYEVIRPSDLPFGGRFGYPWTASLLAVPLAWLDAPIAGAVMVAITVGLAAFAVTREHWWRLLMFVSGPAYMIVSSVQWSGLVVAASELPALIGVAGAIKPFAIGVLSYQRRRRDVLKAVAVGAPILALSLILAPRWPIDWLHSMQVSPPGHQYETPLLTWTGAPILLALTRWRRPEARLLFCMAALPQTMFLYDQVLVFLIPRSRVELLVAVILSLALLLVPSVISFDRSTGLGIARAYMPLLNCSLYWPALFMVLRRPNEA
jgi:hypothetical protein